MGRGSKKTEIGKWYYSSKSDKYKWLISRVTKNTLFRDVVYWKTDSKVLSIFCAVESENEIDVQETRNRLSNNLKQLFKVRKSITIVDNMNDIKDRNKVKMFAIQFYCIQEELPSEEVISKAVEIIMSEGKNLEIQDDE